MRNFYIGVMPKNFAGARRAPTPKPNPEKRPVSVVIFEIKLFN
jgi:hypothetical protein